MASFAWNSTTFDGPSSVTKNDIAFQQIRFGYPGLSGVEVIDMDSKTRTVEIIGLHEETTLEDMVTFFDGLDDERKTVASLSIYSGAALYENCKARFFRGRLFAVPTGFKQEFKAVFTQVQPPAAS